MKYGYGRQLSISMNEAEEKIRVSLQPQGFGVLTEIDVKSTLNAKIGSYKILEW